MFFEMRSKAIISQAGPEAFKVSRDADVLVKEPDPWVEIVVPEGDVAWFRRQYRSRRFEGDEVAHLLVSHSISSECFISIHLFLRTVASKT